MDTPFISAAPPSDELRAPEPLGVIEEVHGPVKWSMGGGRAVAAR